MKDAKPSEVSYSEALVLTDNEVQKEDTRCRQFRRFLAESDENAYISTVINGNGTVLVVQAFPQRQFS